MEIKRLVVGELATNCYLLTSRKETAVIDPGGDAQAILKEIKELKVKYIILTHHHFDHVLAVEEVKAKTGAKVLIHRTGEDCLDFKTDFLEEEVKIGEVILKVIHTPGHTKDSVCLLGPDLIFTGDTLFKDGYGRTDLPTSSPADMEASLQKLAGIIKQGMTVYPGHGEFYVN
ncbi:MBL fold metallo-hydrolase [Candidatus Parcubacteria bacterium]|nr:MBL fold metallo-hydrolase [Candidatus Parcubacteria bacterium]